MSNDSIISGFLGRNIPDLADRFEFEITGSSSDNFEVTAKDNKIYIKANNYISAFHGFYCYLKEYCNVQLSWCGNRSIKIAEPVMFDGVYKKHIEQKYRVYLNYCTLCYSMAWWDFDRWEKEIDFMAMNGINMTLAVVGSEAVLYETLIDFGFSEDEALSSISAPTFWAWQLMTNFIGYRPPKSKSYVYERLELGKKILKRFLEFGIKPIQQGFSGHLPAKMIEKYPNNKIVLQNRWCNFEQDAQLDTLDPLFNSFGTAYLNKLKSLMGAHGYYACDPFHENAPPVKGKKYLNQTGAAIDKMYRDFDDNSIWVIQGWTLNYELIKNVPTDRILILDLNSTRTLNNDKLKKYPTVAGMLHDFGGKNAMQGKLALHCENTFLRLKKAGVNVVGSGIFSEAIEQNPVVYDLQFMLLCHGDDVNLEDFIADYIKRRYGKFDNRLFLAWRWMIKTCYRSDGYQENEVGSALASRPTLMPSKAGPCCRTLCFYDTAMLEKSLKLFLECADEFKASDGFQYDICDLARQVLSNRFYNEQKRFAEAYKQKNAIECASIASSQLELLLDIDELLASRREFSLSHRLYLASLPAKNEEERLYYIQNVKLLVTNWGDNENTQMSLHDYSWREWHGLIKDYYYPRWDMFYTYALSLLDKHKRLKVKNQHAYKYVKNQHKSNYDRVLDEFEKSYYLRAENPVKTYDSDVLPAVKKITEKYLGD